MHEDLYRYRFPGHVDLDEVEGTLSLALIAAEGLHGESQVLLDAGHAFDPATRSCVIDATSDVGRDLNRLFTGFLRREFGTEAVKVERLAHGGPATAAAAAAPTRN